MDRPKLEVADIFRRYGEAYRDKHGASMSPVQRRVMTTIEVCRTAALGGHLERCDQCGHERNAYNSCGNRHCPKCQSLARAQWIEDRQAELLDVPYFHVVFTVPEQITAIAYQNKDVVYGILFHATAETLKTIAADPKHLGAEIGFFAVLHTWRQNLQLHPHLHCVVPGGRIVAGRPTLDRFQARLLLAGPGAVPSVPAAVSSISGESLPGWHATVLRRFGIAPGTNRLLPASGEGKNGRVGRLRQTSIRRTSATARKAKSKR